MEHGVIHLFFVSAVVMSISYTVTRERIFEPLRERLGNKDTFFGYLCSCPYCASHWISFIVVPLTGAYYLRVPYDWGFLSTALTWFFSCILVTIIAAFLRVMFFFVDETQGLVKRRQKQVEKVIEHVEHRIEREDEKQQHVQ
ncbi:MAG: hypothetical protein ACJ790_13815 [Myxococcaceae bacterium]